MPSLCFVGLVITPRRFLEEPVVILPACHHLQLGQSPGNPSRNAFPSLGCCFNMACPGLEIAGGHLDFSRVCEHAHIGHTRYLGGFWRSRSARTVEQGSVCMWPAEMNIL